MLTPMPMTMTTMHDGQIMITLARLVDYSIIAVYIDSYVMMSSDLYRTCSYCFYGTCPVVSWISAHQRRISTSLSDVRVICLDTLLYIDGIFTVHVIPFIINNSLFSLVN